MKKLIWACGILYMAAWFVHLWIGTAALRGFFGDGALAFLIHLSTSYVFNTDSHWVHLFSVGFPRDAQLWLNALGLQFALWAHVTDPMTLKYIFVFWQFALPGFFYLILFAVMLRCNKINWIIFPLASWAILSIPVDWNAVNSTRWAMPLFWMYFLLVLFAPSKIETKSFMGALLLGALMWGGLYESVVLQCVLCLGFGALLWWREKNKTPIIYALTSVPGALRAAFDFIMVGHNAPNGLRRLVTIDDMSDPYCLLMLLALFVVLLLVLWGRKIPWHFSIIFYVLLAAVGCNLFMSPYLDIWLQTEMKFDYVILSIILMIVAGGMRVLKLNPSDQVDAAFCVVCVVGTLLWFVQIQQTSTWQSCRADFEVAKGNTPILINRHMMPLVTMTNKIGIIDRDRDFECIWSWTAPWAEILFAPDGRISQWPMLSFWQDFDFVQKEGAVALHTNNWSLTTPTFQPDEGNLPLKTLLYDLTPLYQRVGLGRLLPRAHCQSIEDTNSYWHDYLMSLNDADRHLLFVCPRSSNGLIHD